MKSNSSEVRISFAAHLKPAPVAGFIIYEQNSAKSLSTIFNYRRPRLVKAAKGWYIEYYYRIPVEVRQLYEDKEFYRFRITEDMNRRRGQDKEEYAQWLLAEITNSLRRGYNPFKPEKMLLAEYAYNEPGEDQQDEINITDALQMFLEKWAEKGIEKVSYKKYERYILRFMTWLKKKQIPYRDVKKIDQDHIENFLRDTKREYGFGNREYNNHFDFIRTAFKYFQKKRWITFSPTDGFEKQKTKVTKHRFFETEALNQITTALSLQDPYTYLAFQTVYYLCVRSDKEILNLKVGNIFWEQDKILATETKTDQRYIPMDSNIKEILKNYLKDTSADYYVFGPKGKPALTPAGRGFFSKRFRKVRDSIGLAAHYTLYGAKHTRVIHLKQDGVSDADIMSLTGHKDFVAYAKYLRDLGLEADARKISQHSRKI